VFGGLSKELIQEVKKENDDCAFKKGYFTKDYLQATLEEIPVYFLHNTNLGLDGANIKAK